MDLERAILDMIAILIEKMMIGFYRRERVDEDRQVDAADVSLAYCYGRKRKYMNFKPYYGHSWRSHKSGECINIPA